MNKENIIIRKYQNEIKDIINTIPFYTKNDNIKIERFKYENSKYDYQAFFNNLVSLYNNENSFYSIIDRTINKEKLSTHSNNHYMNLLLNIRENINEFDFKYLCGYIPFIDFDKKKYYLFSNISSMYNNKNQDYIFLSYENYEDYINIPELNKIYNDPEIIEHKKLILSLPIILKYFDKIKIYLFNYKLIINKLKEITKKSEFYLSFLNNIDITNSYFIKNYDEKNKNDYYFMIMAYFIDKEFNISNNLNVETASYILLNLIKKHQNFNNLKIKLPKIEKKEEFIFNDDSNYNIKRYNFFKDKESNIINQPIEPLNKKVSFSDIPIDKNDKIYIIKNNYNIDKNINFYINQIVYIEETYIYNQSSNIEDFKKNLFKNLFFISNFDYIDNFYNTTDFNNKIGQLFNFFYGIEFNYIKINFNNMKNTINVLNIINYKDIDDKIIINIYIKILEIFRILLLYFKTNYDIFNKIDNNNFKFIIKNINLAILVTLDIFFIDYKSSFIDYNKKNIIDYRNDLQIYYIIVPIIFDDNNIMINLSVIIITNFIAMYKMYAGTLKINELFNKDDFLSFDFFNYAYMLDILNNYDYNILENNTYMNNKIEEYIPDRLFWDGVFPDEYLNFSVRKKLWLSIVCDIMFIVKNDQDFKMSFTMDKNNTKRICLVAKEINNDRNDESTLYYVLSKLSDKLYYDIDNEINLDDFIYKLNKYTEKIDISKILQLTQNTTPLKILSMISFFKEKSNKKYEKTFNEILTFLLLFLNKLGFNIKRVLTKNNLIIKISPIFNNENIIKNINNSENNKINQKEIIKLLNDSKDIIKLIEDNTITNDENSELLFSNLNKTNISQDINKFNKKNTLFNYNHSFPDVLKEEDIQLNKDILNEINNFIIKNKKGIDIEKFYEYIPKYTKELTKLFRVKDVFDVLDEKQDSAGNQNNNDCDNINLIKIIDKISKFKRNNETNMIDNLSDEKLEIIIKELLFNRYDNSSYIFDFDNALKTNNYTMLKEIYENLDRFKKQFKICVSDDIMLLLNNLFRINYINSELIYEILIIIKYIKFVIDKLQKKNINISHTNISLNLTNIVSNILKSRLEQRKKSHLNLINRIFLMVPEDIKKKLNVSIFNLDDNNDIIKISQEIINLFKSLKESIITNKIIQKDENKIIQKDENEIDIPEKNNLIQFTI